MVVCKGVLQLPRNLSLADATGLHLPKGPGFFAEPLLGGVDTHCEVNLYLHP